MSLRAGDALREGAQRLTTERGAVLAALWLLFGLLNGTAFQTAIERYNEWLFGTIDASRESAMEETGAPFAGVEAAEPSPLALDVSLGTAVALVVLVSLLSVALRIVVIRGFASEGDAGVPVDATRDFGPTLLHGILASLLVGVTVAVGFGLLVLPGLALVVLYYFVMQAVAVDDEGAVDALRTSVHLVADNAVPVVVLLLVTLALGFAVSAALSALPLPRLAAELVSTAATALVNVYGVAVATAAYRQAKAAEEAVADLDALGEEPGATDV